MNPKDIDYTHSRRQEIGTKHAQEYQTYTIEWLPDSLTWSINGKIIRTLFRSEVNGTKYPSTPSQIQFSIWDGGLSDPETREWAGGPTAWEEDQPAYEMMVDWVDVKCHSPVDPNAWPPKDIGFQDFVNPLAKDLTSPLAKEAIVLGDNAPKFSTLENGGLHWGRFNGGGKSLVGNRSPLPKWNRGVPSFGSGPSFIWKSVAFILSVFALHNALAWWNIIFFEETKKKKKLSPLKRIFFLSMFTCMSTYKKLVYLTFFFLPRWRPWLLSVHFSPGSVNPLSSRKSFFFCLQNDYLWYFISAGRRGYKYKKEEKEMKERKKKYFMARARGYPPSRGANNAPQLPKYANAPTTDPSKTWASLSRTGSWRWLHCPQRGATL